MTVIIDMFFFNAYSGEMKLYVDIRKILSLTQYIRGRFMGSISGDFNVHTKQISIYQNHV